MEGRRNHRLPVVALALIVGILQTGVALADQPPPSYNEQLTTTTVYTDSNGAVIDSQYQAHSGSGTGTLASGSSGPRCYLKEVPGSEMTEDMVTQYWAMHMDYAPYYVICGNQNKGVVWIEIQISQPGNTSSPQNPRDIAMRLRDRMPVPQVTVRMNPSEGLVGTESWFWLQGYRGAPVTDSTNAFSQRIQVQATVTHYEWSFGDGSTLTSDTPGHAYPSRSEVRHTYDRSSNGLPYGYVVQVNFVFAVRYRVGGGSWIDIPGITRTAQSDYPVQESQAVIQQ